MLDLTKGQTAQLIDLVKDSHFPNFKIGAAWIKKPRRSFLGIKFPEKCDLDLSAFAIVNGKVKDEFDCSFQSDKSNFMKSSGDDLVGGGKKNKDNEIISINMSKIPKEVESIVITINSFTGERFCDLDYMHIRVYEGEDNKPRTMHCKYEVSNDRSFDDGKTIIIGAIMKQNNKWKFKAIGDVKSYQYIAHIKDDLNNNPII